MAQGSGKSTRFGFFFFGVLTTVVGIAAFAFLYFRFGNPPVATADPSFPLEAQIVKVPLDARIKREMQTSPIQADEAGLEAGAHLYVAQCASCHGTPNHDVAFAKWMFPKAPQLWNAHGKGIVGVSDDEVGETYWKIDNGIRLTGMPAYQKVLSSTEMWQVAVLVKNADKPQSPELQTILQGGPTR